MSRQPELYRTPQKPGYLGGYNWRPTCFGLLLLVIVNFAATQFIAARFEYQPALGHPLLRSKTGRGIYEPFAWVIWGWHNSTSQDPRVRKPLFEGEMMVFAGSFLCVGIFFAAATRRSRKLMENADDLHGSARWATQQDIRTTGLMDAERGVYVGAWRAENSSRLHYLRHNGPEHILAFAPTRSGKGVGLVIPTLLAWSESAVIYDIKGENWAKTAGFRAQQGHLLPSQHHRPHRVLRPVIAQLQFRVLQEPIDIGQLEWRGLPMHLLTYIVQRGILAVEATVDAAVDYQAAIEKHHDAAFAEKRAAVWNGGGSANTYYNKLPGLLNSRYMLCNSDRDLWATTKRFYSEIRNPLFHGYELSSPRPNSVLEILDYLAAMMQWIETWCVWSGRHLLVEGRRRSEPQ